MAKSEIAKCENMDSPTSIQGEGHSWAQVVSSGPSIEIQVSIFYFEVFLRKNFFSGLSRFRLPGAGCLGAGRPENGLVPGGPKFLKKFFSKKMLMAKKFSAKIGKKIFKNFFTP